jgi:hypothetical protein
MSYTEPSTVDVAISADNNATITFAENIQTMTKEPRKLKNRRNNTETETTDEQETSVVFIYDSYSLVVPNRDGLEAEVKANRDEWLHMAIEQEVQLLSSEIRAKRNKLLSETDADVAIDRLNLTIPEKITTSTLLNAVKSVFEGLSKVLNGDMAKYRQELRDLPEQPGFPYNVVFPNKPKQ